MKIGQGEAHERRHKGPKRHERRGDEPHERHPEKELEHKEEDEVEHDGLMAIFPEALRLAVEYS